MNTLTERHEDGQTQSHLNADKKIHTHNAGLSHRLFGVINLSLREYLLFCREHVPMLFACCIATFSLAGAWQFGFLRIMDFYNLEAYSLADALVITASSPVPYTLYGILLVPLALIMLMRTTEHDYFPNQVVRQARLSHIWIRQCVKSLCVASTMTVMVIIAVLVCGSLVARSLVSFDDPRGLFSFYTAGRTLPDVSFIQIFGMFCLYTLLIMFAMMLLWSFLDLLIKKRWASFVIVVLCGFAEVLSEVGGLYSWAGISYRTWLPGAQQYLWALIPAIAILCFSGTRLIRKRLIF
jgi:hypothetical protein